MLIALERDGVLVIALSNGKVNALDLDILVDLKQTFAQLSPGQPVVLTGSGRVFSAGVDLRDLVDGDDGYMSAFVGALSDAFLAVFDHDGPVVAAVNGPAIAGGYVLAAAADMRILSRGTICLAELSVGVPLPAVALELVRGVAGPFAQYLVTTARSVEPDEARQRGLVDELSPADQLLDRAIERARALGALPDGVFAFTKRQLQRDTRERILAHLSEENRVIELWCSPPVRLSVAGYVSRLGGSG